MTPAEFQRRNQDSWNALRSLSDRLASDGVRRLGADEVVRVARLYRKATSDLAKARTLGLADAPLRWLNDLCARTHGRIYLGRRLRARTVHAFVLSRVPALLRAHAAPLALAAGLFALAVALAYLAAGRDPSLARILGPAGGAELTTGGFARLAVHAVVGGLALGVGALIALALGGAAAGATLALTAEPGRLLLGVAPHAPLALVAVLVATAAALRTGWRAVAPGPRSRRDAVAHAAWDGAALLLLAAALLLLALLVETFVSASGLGLGGRLAVGSVGLLFPGAYASLGRRP
jgi:uncharacterized membrane protein SpoIIM required for sporulation